MITIQVCYSCGHPGRERTSAAYALYCRLRSARCLCLACYDQERCTACNRSRLEMGAGVPYKGAYSRTPQGERLCEWCYGDRMAALYGGTPIDAAAHPL